jgi:hypothetical protein
MSSGSTCVGEQSCCVMRCLHTRHSYDMPRVRVSARSAGSWAPQRWAPCGCGTDSSTTRANPSLDLPRVPCASRTAERGDGATYGS